MSLVGVLIGALATGALSMTLGGPAWVALAFPLLPGVYWSLRVTVADALALGFVLAALALAARSRHGWAIAVGCLAVLAKEPVILILLGWSIARQTRRDWLMTVIPGLVIALWMVWLRIQLPADPPRATQDIGLPFVGLYDAWTQIWSQGQEWVGMACTIPFVKLAPTDSAVSPGNAQSAPDPLPHESNSRGGAAVGQGGRLGECDGVGHAARPPGVDDGDRSAASLAASRLSTRTTISATRSSAASLVAGALTTDRRSV